MDFLNVKTLLLIVLMSLLPTCKSTIEKIKTEEQTCKIDLSVKDFKEEVIIGHGFEKRYLMADSAIIYVTDEDSPSNLVYNYIRASGQYSIRQFLRDTLILKGMTPDGKRWEDRKLGTLTVGYVNVPKEKMQLYQRILDSFSCH